MKFARYLRSQNIKQIEHCFSNAESRLYDDTYTKEEVKTMLSDIEKIVKFDMESELINFSHNNVLMLQQLFTQAEKWYLRLEIDISELQNQELLEMIQKLETDENQLAKPKGTNEALTEEGTIALLRIEIERLKADNERLSNMIQDVEDKADLYKDEKNKLSEKLTNAQKEIKNYKVMLVEDSRDKNPKGDPSVVKKMEEKLMKVENLLTMNKEKSENNQEKLKMELISTREKVKQVEAQLQLAELVNNSLLNYTKGRAKKFFSFFFRNWRESLARRKRMQA